MGDTPEGEPRVPFSNRGFHEKLIRFIVANDLVSLRLVSLYSICLHLACKSLSLVDRPEFREMLLFLKSDLEIPHRTKLSELVVHAWKEYFQVLKCELQVVNS